MYGQGSGLTNKPHLDGFVVYVAFGQMWFIIRYKYWGCNWSLETGMHTNLRRTKTFGWMHNAKKLALPPCDRPEMYVLRFYWSAGWELSCFLFVPSPSIFAYYFGFFLRCYKADEAKFLQTGTTEFLIVVLIMLLAAATWGWFHCEHHRTALCCRRLAWAVSDTQQSDA